MLFVLISFLKTTQIKPKFKSQRELQIQEFKEKNKKG